MFDNLIRPIPTYESDVWGLRKAGLDVMNKVFFNFIRCTLNVKATTCNAIVYGECGRYPLRVFCHIDVLCYVFNHSIFVIRKSMSRVFRHSNIISRMPLMVIDCTLLVLLRQLNLVTEFSVTFVIDLQLNCRQTAKCSLVAIFNEETVLCMTLSWSHNNEFR